MLSVRSNTIVKFCRNMRNLLFIFLSFNPVIIVQEDIPEEAGEDEADPIPSAIQEESEEEIELEAPVEKEEEECLVLEGDSDPNVLIVNSQTELIPSHPSVTPKFEIVEAETLVELKEAAPEPAAGK